MANVDPANVIVLFIVVGFISFVIYVAIQGRIEEQKSKKEQENKK